MLIVVRIEVVVNFGLFSMSFLFFMLIVGVYV